MHCTVSVVGKTIELEIVSKDRFELLPYHLAVYTPFC